MDSVMFAAPTAKQMELIRAHPELAGRLARLGQLSEASRCEQSRAGLDSLKGNQIAKINQLNAEYRNKFGVPFFICGRLNDPDSIVSVMRARLENNPGAKFK